MEEIRFALPSFCRMHLHYCQQGFVLEFYWAVVVVVVAVVVAVVIVVVVAAHSRFTSRGNFEFDCRRDSAVLRLRNYLSRAN